ncbi:MAG: AraC family transcriptional regulator [Fuerstiella sp.]|nr:AraC family transcriptional regulator [Fuerstiella sp.]MCP4854545.1 AraC family transcriptional regulator [Fuerstiella sp.]
MKRDVALIIETSNIYGRDLLSGIVRYMRMHDQWSVFLEQRDLWKQPPTWLNDWKGDGIISRATTPKLLEAVAETGVPFVEVTEPLLSTDLSAERIAVLCGFEHPEYLHVVFKRVTGMTPGEFRRKAKP